MRCFTTMDRCWAPPAHRRNLRSRSERKASKQLLLTSADQPSAAAPAVPARAGVMPPRPPPQGRSISGAREGSSSTGLSRGGGWMVSLGLFCSAVLWVVCAVGLLDTQGTLVQRTFALLAGALAVLLTPYSGFGFRARAVHAIAPVIPRPIRL
ncbi:hypothetical protein EMIHUDRAFT_253750, partial [Emiliania huxleyi CCMP1516]|uniref:Uncharacterized protein n=2 Tax=Emiliania huxleyi TaxID=2903 RepID=A0A0D3K3G8_EMIH1